jgi:hypothetical protein
MVYRICDIANAPPLIDRTPAIYRVIKLRRGKPINLQGTFNWFLSCNKDIV